MSPFRLTYDSDNSDKGSPRLPLLELLFEMRETNAYCLSGLSLRSAKLGSSEKSHSAESLLKIARDSVATKRQL